MQSSMKSSLILKTQREHKTSFGYLPRDKLTFKSPQTSTRHKTKVSPKNAAVQLNFNTNGISGQSHFEFALVEKTVESDHSESIEKIADEEPPKRAVPPPPPPELIVIPPPPPPKVEKVRRT